MLSRFTGFQGGDVGERVYERMCHANFKAACGLLSLTKASAVAIKEFSARQLFSLC